MNDQEIYYIHELSSTVVSLSDLRKIENTTKIVIRIPYFDEIFKEYFNEEFVFNRIDILTGRDWIICPITRDSLTKDEIEEIRNCLYKSDKELYRRVEGKLSETENSLLSIKGYETIKGFEKDDFGLQKQRSLGGNYL